MTSPYVSMGFVFHEIYIQFRLNLFLILNKSLFFSEVSFKHLKVAEYLFNVRNYQMK